MKLTKKFKLDTYTCEVELIITDNLIDEVNKIYKKFKLSEKFDEPSEGLTLTIDLDKYYIIINNEYLTHNTIAHEVYHLVVQVTEDRDIKDQEAQAWLCGHITEIVYKFLEKKKLIIKHGR